MCDAPLQPTPVPPATTLIPNGDIASFYLPRSKVFRDFHEDSNRKSCIAFVHITIPTLEDVDKQIKLFLLGA